ncbi:hypothetical protein FSP39_006329 [Pinctada imbricata]|uniref:Uncharacterized protein n=1 Tax=Pinctada imbricata TaxID=66713 RepID=A0AA88YHH7_PINIB|nr:hypothetical protein FSP39_006329 [Pinctada imbricata]
MNCYQKFYTNQIHSSSLLCQLATMWKSQVLCDAIIKSGTISIKAHRVVLVAACPMLQSMENASIGSHLEVRLASDIKEESINTFLQYLYEGFMLLTEENCKDVEKIGRLLQVDSVIKCCGDFFKCLSTRTGSVDLSEEYRYSNFRDVEFRHVRSSDMQKTLKDRPLKRGLDTNRPISPLHKRQRFHSSITDDAASMSQSYDSPSPWDRVPHPGTPIRHGQSSQGGVIDMVGDSLELLQTDPPGTVNLTEGRSNNKSVSIAVSSQLNSESDIQIVNVENRRQEDTISGSHSQNRGTSNQRLLSDKPVPVSIHSPQRQIDLDSSVRRQQASPLLPHHPSMSVPTQSPQAAESSFTSSRQFDTSPQSSHMISSHPRPGLMSKPFAMGSAPQSSSSDTVLGVRGPESQNSESASVDTGQNARSASTQDENKTVKTDESVTDFGIVKIESDDSNTGGLDMYVDTREDGMVKLTRNSDNDMEDSTAGDQSLDWSRDRVEGGPEMDPNSSWFTGQQGHGVLPSHIGKTLNKPVGVAVWEGLPLLSGQPLYTCDLCQKGFNSRQGFDNHKKMVHGSKEEYSRELIPGYTLQKFGDDVHSFIPVAGASNKACVVCKSDGLRTATGLPIKSYYRCGSCNVALCRPQVRNCFARFHSEAWNGGEMK